MAHFGQGRTCPHIKSETQVRAMLAALKNSNEEKSLVDAAMKYLRGVKGTLVQAKKKNAEKAAGLTNTGDPDLTNNGAALGPGDGLVAPPPPKPRGQMIAGKFLPYAGPANGNVGGAVQGPPPRETPAWYKGPEAAHEQARLLQMQAQGQLDEGEMESALRGFLGH